MEEDKEEEKNEPNSKNGLIVFIVLLLLFFTNPSKDDYSNWVLGQPDGAIETFGVEVVAKPMVYLMTTRTNFWVFSIFTTGALGAETKTIGFGKIVFFTFNG